MTEGELFSEVCRLDLLVKALEYKLADTEACNARLVEQVEQLTAELAEWKADAERLANKHTNHDISTGMSTCVHCRRFSFGAYPIIIPHKDTCPITLHRQLEEKYGQVVDK